MAVRGRIKQPLTAFAPPAKPRHVRFRPAFINENEA
jgi:hypothetical protein